MYEAMEDDPEPPQPPDNLPIIQRVKQEKRKKSEERVSIQGPEQKTRGSSYYDKFIGSLNNFPLNSNILKPFS